MIKDLDVAIMETEETPSTNELGTILVIEDDPRMQKVLQRMFSAENYEVLRAGDGQTGLELFKTRRPVAVVLDLILPQISGRELCQQFKALSPDTPVIVVSAIAEVVDKVLLLELGADDYIPKPFSPRELVARVKAVLRRFERPLSQAPVKIGDIEIDPGAMTLTVSGNLVTTTATEFRLLDYFARHIGRVFTRDQLLDSVWRDTAYVTPRSVDVYVRRIREKIEPDPENPRYLKTVRGAGYRFEAPK